LYPAARSFAIALRHNFISKHSEQFVGEMLESALPDYCLYCEHHVESLEDHMEGSRACRKLAAAENKPKKKTVVTEESFEDWQELENGNTKIPPREVDTIYPML
jgi:hypothetical protein